MHARLAYLPRTIGYTTISYAPIRDWKERLRLAEKIFALALTSYAILKYGVPYFPDMSIFIFIFIFGVFEIVLGFHFVLDLFNRVISAIYLMLLVSAVPIFGEWLNHFTLFAAALVILTQGSGPYKIDVHFNRQPFQTEVASRYNDAIATISSRHDSEFIFKFRHLIVALTRATDQVL